MKTSKLAQARIEKDLTQTQVADYMSVDVGTVCRWEKGLQQPYPRHMLKLRTLFGKSAQALGFPSSEEDEATISPVPPAPPLKEGDHAFAKYFQRDLELRLNSIMHDWLCGKKPEGLSCVILQYRISQELEDAFMNEPLKQNHDHADMPRRDALRRIALLPIPALSLDALGNAVSKWALEDILPHCAAGITACEQLSKGLSEDMGLAYRVLTTYLPPLKGIVDQSAPHRQEAARLVAQALLIKATLSLHREGPKRAVSYGKQAEIYSKESQYIPLQLVVLKRLAWMYACDKQEKLALEKALQAKSLLEKHQKKGLPIHSFLQSSVLGGVAKYAARHGQGDEALSAMHDAYDSFASSENSEDSAADTIDDFNYSTLLLEDGLTYYHLEQYDKALVAFEQAVDLNTLDAKVPASSMRVRIEIINHGTLASLKHPTKDMELSTRLWKAGIQGAIDLRSEQRFNEALEALSIMQALWPGDSSIKELRDLAWHW